MSCTRNAIVAQAQAWLGLKESDGSHKKIIDVYNSHKPLARGYKLKYTDAWCSGFASAVAIACNATDIIPTEVGCDKHITLFKNKGIWVENDAYVPAPGDYIFYDWDDSGKGDNLGYSDHIGIVEKVADGKITVIEGNYSNSVKRRVLAVNGKYIRGYGVPKYDEEKQPEKQPEKKPEKSIDELARDVINGKYGNGAERKEKLGDLYDAVQDRVNELLKPKTESKPVPQQKIVHTVVQNDTLWGIAKKYLGSGSRYPEIMKLNGLTSTVIRIGEKLTIPNK